MTVMRFCQKCGAQIAVDQAVICVKCGAPIQMTAATGDENAAIRMILPVGRSCLSLIAGYLGLLSLIPGIGVLSIVVGLLAIRDIKSHPEKHGLGRAWFGVVAGGISLLFWLLFFVALAGGVE